MNGHQAVRCDSHPALHEPSSHPGTGHFVPESWDVFDRGICPCGEAVRWDESEDIWVKDRSLVIFVLEREEANTLVASAPDDETHWLLTRQLLANEGA